MGRVSPEIKNYLLSVGFIKKSDSLFVITDVNNIDNFLLYVTGCGRYRLVLEGYGRGLTDAIEIFRGFEIRNVEDLKYLLNCNVFTSRLLNEKTSNVYSG